MASFTKSEPSVPIRIPTTVGCAFSAASASPPPLPDSSSLPTKDRLANSTYPGLDLEILLLSNQGQGRVCGRTVRSGLLSNPAPGRLFSVCAFDSTPSFGLPTIRSHRVHCDGVRCHWRKTCLSYHCSAKPAFCCPRRGFSFSLPSALLGAPSQSVARFGLWLGYPPSLLSLPLSRSP